jgi:hypothetical protein
MGSITRITWMRVFIMGSITRITWMSGRPLKHERSYFVGRPPSQKRNG